MFYVFYPETDQTQQQYHRHVWTKYEDEKVKSFFKEEIGDKKETGNRGPLQGIVLCQSSAICRKQSFLSHNRWSETR